MSAQLDFDPTRHTMAFELSSWKLIKNLEFDLILILEQKANLCYSKLAKIDLRF